MPPPVPPAYIRGSLDPMWDQRHLPRPYNPELTVSDPLAGLKTALGDFAVERIILPNVKFYIQTFCEKEWTDPATAAQKAAEIEAGVTDAIEGGIRAANNDPSAAPPQ